MLSINFSIYSINSRFMNKKKVHVDFLSPCKPLIFSAFCLRDPGGNRTHDPLIKSQLLYQLSYRVKLLVISEKQCKVNPIFGLNKPIFGLFLAILLGNRALLPYD